LAVLPGRASGLVVLVLVSPRSLRAPRDVSRKRLFQQRPIRMDDDLPSRTLPNTCSGHGDVARVRQLAEHLGLGSAPGWVVSLFFGSLGTAAAVMSLVYVVGLLVTPFAGSETKGKPLPA
jgi:hypothetical protein